MLMDGILVFKEALNSPKFNECFLECSESQDSTVQISSLRIYFAFCSSEITVVGFTNLIPTFIGLLIASMIPATLVAYSLNKSCLFL
jgi:hypothetical protein